MKLSINELIRISNDSKNKQDNTTFPHASDMNKLLSNLNYLKQPKNRIELANLNQFSNRQGDCYGNALCYLGFAIKQGSRYALSYLGTYLIRLTDFDEQKIIIINQILEKKIFNQVFINTMKNDCNFDNNYIINVILKYAKDVNSPLTAKRRAITVKSWITWILNNNNQVNVI